jgi:hypothetical protein
LPSSGALYMSAETLASAPIADTETAVISAVHEAPTCAGASASAMGAAISSTGVNGESIRRIDAGAGAGAGTCAGAGTSGGANAGVELGVAAGGEHEVANLAKRKHARPHTHYEYTPLVELFHKPNQDVCVFGVRIAGRIPRVFSFCSRGFFLLIFI